jgi:integrase
VPKRAITQLFLDRIAPPKAGRVEYWDTKQPGLFLRVSASGAKSWATMYRVKGKQIKETLGTLAEIPKVDEARRRALASLEKARSGINPVEERRVATEAAGKDTFAAIAGRFLTEYVEINCRPKTHKEWKRVVEKELIPKWGTKPIREITDDDVLHLQNAKAKTRPKQADEILKVLRRLCRWGVGVKVLATDPTEGVTKRVKKREARERTLSDEEIKLFWPGCDRLGWPFGSIFKLMLLTGQREGEVGGMRWSELDLTERTWNLAGHRTKNRKAHTVHLSEMAVDVLINVPRTTCELLFASRSPKAANDPHPPSGYSKAKERLDGHMIEPREPWVLHDLRRTAATGMARLGIAQPVVEKVLNHISGQVSGVAAIYNRHDYKKEREAALEAWGQYVEGLVRPGGSVVDLRQRAVTV